MSYQNLSRDVAIERFHFLARLVGVYTLTAEDVSELGDYPGMKEGLQLYSFVEQTYDPKGGIPADATPGRQTMNASGPVGGQSMPVADAPTSGWATEDNNSFLSISNTVPPAYTNPGIYVEMRLTGIVLGSPTYEFFWGGNNLAWVKATSSTSSTINLGRTVTDAVLNGTTTLTSALANFTSDDVGAVLIGTDIPTSPSPTTIASVTNSTTIVMSAAATGSLSNVTVQIVTGTIKAYAAVVDTENTKTGVWSGGQTVWLQQANDSAWLPLVGGVEPILVPVVSGQIYQCRYFTTDDNNVPIWTVAQVDNTQELEAAAASVSLSTSWTDISGMSVVLPPGQSWKATVTVTATITASASGAGDSVSFRLVDSSSIQWGRTMTGCNAVCNSISFTDCVAVQGTGSGGVTLNVQAIISTTSGSTATMVEGSIIATTI